MRWSQLPVKPLPEVRQSLSELSKGTQTTSSTAGAVGGPTWAEKSAQLQPQHLPLLPWEVGIPPNPWGSHFKDLNLDIIIIFFSVLENLLLLYHPESTTFSHKPRII